MNATSTNQDPNASPLPPLVLEEVLLGISNGTRWRILKELSRGGRQVIEICELLSMKSTNVSKHMRVLRLTGLVKVSRAGVYFVPPEYLVQAGVIDYGHCLLRLDAGA